jgi:dehydrogenase/reductase SDR family protein 7B
LNLRDRTVLITGASSGLGRALAVECYRAGAKVILTARSIDRLRDLCEDLKSLANVDNPHEPVYRYLDLSDPNGFDDLLALTRNGHIDVLINNAGISMRGSCDETPLTMQKRVFDVNYFGQIAITKAVLHCIPDDGAIVVIGSVQGRIAVPYRCAYSASKHALQVGVVRAAMINRLFLGIFRLHAGRGTGAIANSHGHCGVYEDRARETRVESTRTGESRGRDPT